MYTSVSGEADACMLAHAHLAGVEVLLDEPANIAAQVALDEKVVGQGLAAGGECAWGGGIWGSGQ